MTSRLEKIKKKLPLRAVNLAKTANRGKIGTITEVLDKSEKLGWRLRQGVTHFYEPSMIAPIRADKSVPDGQQLEGNIVKVTGKDGNCWCPKEAIGNAFRVTSVHPEGICLSAPKDVDYGNNYFVGYEHLEVVPNYIDGFRLNTKKELVRDTLSYSHYDGEHVKWLTSKETYVSDVIVRDNISDALDLARRHDNFRKIKVNR